MGHRLHVRLWVIMNAKREIFLAAYLKTFNATLAATVAGYAHPGKQGHRLLKNVEIAAAVREHLDTEAMTADEVLYHLAQIARGNIGLFLDSSGNVRLDTVKAHGLLVKRVNISTGSLELYDRLRALELLAKAHGLFVERIEVNDWRTRAVQDIQAGLIDYEALAEAFDSDLATDLFTQAGVPISNG